MFPEARYLAWANRLFGTVELDLATSGIPLLRAEELAPLAEEGARRAADVACFAELRTSLARYNDVPTEEVVPALGASQAIHLAYAAMLSPSDEVLVEAPAYEPLASTAEGLGARVRGFARDPARGFRVDPARLASAMSPRTRAVVISNLHNPTGVREDDEAIAELAAVCAAHGSYLVVDEVYAPFDRLAESGVFSGSARKLAPNVVALGSLTKGFGLGMLRVGWLLGPKEIARRAGDAALATVGHLPLAHASFGLAALARIPELSRRARSKLAGKRDMAEAWARNLGLGWSAPAAGLFGLVTVPGAEGRDILPDIEAFAADQGVLVSAGTFFGVPDGFRLSWASCDAARFAEGLTRLATMPVIARGAPAPEALASPRHRAP